MTIREQELVRNLATGFKSRVIYTDLYFQHYQGSKTDELLRQLAKQAGKTRGQNTAFSGRRPAIWSLICGFIRRQVLIKNRRLIPLHTLHSAHTHSRVNMSHRNQKEVSCISPLRNLSGV